MSLQVVTASTLAALTLFMAAALVTVTPAQNTVSPTVAAAQTAQPQG